MRVVVTGAGGFLGRHVVRSLAGRGHEVRAMIRPAADPAGVAQESVQVIHADLRRPDGLAAALDGAEAVVHLAAAVTGDDDAVFAATVAGTENLLTAVRAAGGVRRVVLASSFTVYDWPRIPEHLTEDSPTVGDVETLDRRGGYTVAKVWQERLLRRAAEQDGTELVILRPGWIWAGGHEPFAGIGQQLGGLHVVFGPRRLLPLAYVENCADCFAEATENPAAAAQTFNVLDDEPVSAWRFTTAYLRLGPGAGRALPLPYAVAHSGALGAAGTGRALFGKGAELPSIVTPERFEARFKPLTYSTERLRTVLGWRPPWSFEAALQRTYDRRRP